MKYSPEHIWLLADGDAGTVGIPEFAQSELNENVFVDLPAVGTTFSANAVFGSIDTMLSADAYRQKVGA